MMMMAKASVRALNGENEGGDEDTDSSEGCIGSWPEVICYAASSKMLRCNCLSVPMPKSYWFPI